MTSLKDIAGKLKTGWEKTKTTFNENAEVYLATRMLPYITMEITKSLLRHDFKQKAADPRRSKFSRNLYKAGIALTYVPLPISGL